MASDDDDSLPLPSFTFTFLIATARPLCFSEPRQTEPKPPCAKGSGSMSKELLVNAFCFFGFGRTFHRFNRTNPINLLHVEGESHCQSLKELGNWAQSNP